MEQSAYIPPDIKAMIYTHGDDYVQGGETCHIDALKKNFAWMRGFVYAWYGWPNDGKSTMTEYLAVVKAKFGNWKWCLQKPEDMDTVINDQGKAEIKANGIYYDLSWILTGKPWNKKFANSNRVNSMTLEERTEAMEFIEKHFYIIYPRDKKFKNMKDNFMSIYEKYGVDAWIIDPWNTIKLPEGERGDERLVDAFIQLKELAMETNSCINLVSHPRSGIDQRESKKKNAPFKIVDQFMQLGGSPWDTKMDGQFSIYRPNRHLDRNDPAVEFHNLKQKKKELVGVRLGEVGNIIFDEVKRRYYFNDIDPMDGSSRVGPKTVDIFATEPKPQKTDDLPF